MDAGAPSEFQAGPKSSQIEQNPAKRNQRKSKEKAWISLDSLRRIEPFQGPAATPLRVNFFCPFALFIIASAGPPIAS
jgi:hypothetical protein